MQIVDRIIAVMQTWDVGLIKDDTNPIVRDELINLGSVARIMGEASHRVEYREVSFGVRSHYRGSYMGFHHRFNALH